MDCVRNASANSVAVNGNVTVYHGRFAAALAQLACINITGRLQSNTDFNIMNVLNLYLTPVIISVGIVGNVLSFLVFATTHLKKQSSSVYLATLAIADTGFLVSLLIVWLGTVQVNVLQRDGWCQTVVYMSHVFSFLSVYNVLCFTAERYVIIYIPLRKDQFCSTQKARLVVLTLSVVALVGYSYITWTTGIVPATRRASDGRFITISACTPFPRFYDLNTVTDSINILVTLLFPSVAIIVLNGRMIVKIHKVQKARTLHWQNANSTLYEPTALPGRYVHTSVSPEGALHYTFGSAGQQDSSTQGAPQERSSSSRTRGSGCRGRCEHSPVQSALCPPPNSLALPSPARGPRSVSGAVSAGARSPSAPGLKSRGQFRFARMLLVVSSIFVLLHIPPHYLRIQSFVQQFSGTHKISRKQLHWNKLLQLVYHMSFAINFFLYSAMGTSFRRGMQRLWTRWTYRLSRCCGARLAYRDYENPEPEVREEPQIPLRRLGVLNSEPSGANSRTIT